MDQVIAFVKDYWVLIVVGIIVLIGLKFLKQVVMKVIGFLVVIGVILVLFFNYTPHQVLEMGKSVASTASDLFKSTVNPMLESEVKDAKYVPHDDGTYELKTQHLRIVGKKGSPDATIYYGEHSFQVNIKDLSDLVQQQIQKAQQS